MDGLRQFEIKGVGMVMADITRPEYMPAMYFEDGTTCVGLSRSREEVYMLGYGPGDIGKVNYIHECTHLFLSWKGDYVKSSVAYLAGHGETFESRDMVIQASYEEKLILGFQIYLNQVLGDWVSNVKVSGFSFHIAHAAMQFAKSELFNKYNLDLTALRKEFELLIGCDLLYGGLCTEERWKNAVA